ncbi:MAG: glycosyltransferase [Clostridia bacterium]|nr:glycosyltransferase [Clostridia bacterium]
MKKILFVCENPLSNQSTKHRVLDIIEHLSLNNYKIYCGRKVKIGKSIVMLISLKDFFKIIFEIKKFDVLFIQRTSTIFIYWICLIAKWLKKEIVFDIDDAIFIKRVKGFKNPLYAFYDKIAKISSFIFAGSHYISDYTGAVNPNTFLIPTAFNTKIFNAEKFCVKVDQDSKFIIGWLGGGEVHLENLKLIKKPLKELSKKYNIRFKMVSSLGSVKIRKEFEEIKSLEVDYGRDQWIPLEDIPKEMMDFDVSVMPLLDDPFMRGKCSLKAVESMALKIPVVISGVGENNYLIQHNQNGFIANTPEEWVVSLEKLINDPTQRERIGENGCRTVMDKYSIEVVAEQIKKVLKI